MEQLSLFDDLEPQDSGLLNGVEAYESLGAIDREKVKQQILDAVKNNVINWTKPWKPSTHFYKINGRVLSGVINGYTCKPYTSATNIMQLITATAYRNLFAKEGTPEYFPVFVPVSLVKSKGWKMKGYSVVEDAARIIYQAYWEKVKDEKLIEKLEEEYKKTGKTKVYLYRRIEENVWVYHTWKFHLVVFAQDIEGEPIKVEPIKAKEAEMIEYVDNIILAAKDNVAPVKNDEVDRCYYIPAYDQIHLVPPRSFDNINEYYSTRFHESAHSTMHPKRTNRCEVFSNNQRKWGDKYYANEELVAEISAYLLCSSLGLAYYAKSKLGVKDDSTGANSVAYLAGWVRKAKELYNDDEEKAILTAYGYACQAVDYILKGIDFEAMIPERIKQLEDEDARDSIEYQGKTFRVEHAKDAERLRVFFASIPTAETRDYMKKHGFHYSASFKAWQIKDDDKGRKEINELIRLFDTAKPTAPTTAPTNSRLRLLKIQAQAKLKLQQQRMRA